MTRSEEGTSTNEACRRQGPARRTRSASHIVSSLTMEELRTYCEIPNDIDLKLMEKSDDSTMGWEHNDVFFTREQLTAGLRFPVSSLVKQFFAFYQGTADPCSSQRNPNSHRMQSSELLIPARPFAGQDLLRLFFDIKARGPDVFVDPRLQAAVREWTPRFS